MVVREFVVVAEAEGGRWWDGGGGWSPWRTRGEWNGVALGGGPPRTVVEERRGLAKEGEHRRKLEDSLHRCASQVCDGGRQVVGSGVKKRVESWVSENGVVLKMVRQPPRSRARGLSIPPRRYPRPRGVPPRPAGSRPRTAMRRRPCRRSLLPFVATNVGRTAAIARHKSRRRATPPLVRTLRPPPPRPRLAPPLSPLTTPPRSPPVRTADRLK